MITINRETLSAMTQAAASVAKSGAASPAAELAFVSTFDGRITVQASDMENWLSLSADAAGDIGDVQVNAAKLNDLVSKMRGDAVKMDVSGTDLTLSAKGKRKIAGVIVAYPVVTPPDGDAIIFEADQLKAAIAFAANSMADDMILKPQYCGVHLHTHDGHWYAAAYNGHSGFGAIRFAEADTEAAITVPASTIKLLKWVPEGAQVAMRMSDRLISFEWQGGRIVGKQIEGRFVPYRKAIPTHDTFLAVRPSELSAAVRAVAAVAADEKASKSKMIEIDLGPEVSVNVASQVGQGSEPIDAEWNGDPMKMRLASRRLLEALTGFGDDEVHIGMSDYPEDRTKVKAITFRSADDDARFAMLMPIS